MNPLIESNADLKSLLHDLLSVKFVENARYEFLPNDDEKVRLKNTLMELELTLKFMDRFVDDNIPLLNGSSESNKHITDKLSLLLKNIKNITYTGGLKPNLDQTFRDSFTYITQSWYPPYSNEMYTFLLFLLTNRAIDEGRDNEEKHADLERIHQSAKQIDIELNNMLNQVKDKLQKKAMVEKSNEFSKQAEAYLTEGWKWMASGVALAVITLVVVLLDLHCGIFGQLVGTEYHDIVRNISSRVIVLSLLLYGSIWSFRNYSSLKHNAIINKHRSNALSTFELFVSSTKDEQTKSAVLLEATRAIFAPQSSGYNKGESENQPTSTIVELLREVKKNA